MVVGIYSVPDAVSPKRRFPESLANLLPCGRPTKRWKNDETEVVLEAQEVAEPASSLVFYEENDGIWHVDNLLELLAGALCATFGADPLDMTCTSDGPSANLAHEAPASQESKSLQQLQHNIQISDPLHQLQLLLQQTSPPTSKLTEGNLRQHTAAVSQHAATPRKLVNDDDDRSSIASLSVWVVGTQSPRRRVSDGGVQQHSSGTLGAAAFSFPRRCSSASGSVDMSASITINSARGGSSGCDAPDMRWLRRCLPTAGRW